MLSPVFVLGAVWMKSLMKMQRPRWCSLKLLLAASQKCCSWARRSCVLLWGLCFHGMVRTVRTTFSCFSKLLPRREAINGETFTMGGTTEKCSPVLGCPPLGAAGGREAFGRSPSFPSLWFDPHDTEHHRVKLTFKSNLIGKQLFYTLRCKQFYEKGVCFSFRIWAFYVLILNCLDPLLSDPSHTFITFTWRWGFTYLISGKRDRNCPCVHSSSRKL